LPLFVFATIFCHQQFLLPQADATRFGSLLKNLLLPTLLRSCQLPQATASDIAVAMSMLYRFSAVASSNRKSLLYMFGN
jgi:hypothetical protein